jgi:hypothetical protein
MDGEPRSQVLYLLAAVDALLERAKRLAAAVAADVARRSAPLRRIDLDPDDPAGGDLARRLREIRTRRPSR